MRRFLLLVAFSFFPTIFPISSQAQEIVRHHMKIVLDVEKHHLDVEDTITIPEKKLRTKDNSLEFFLL